jgi:bacterioferritin-associated ferredoxin
MLREKNPEMPSAFIGTEVIARNHPEIKKEFLPAKKSKEQIRAEKGIVFRGGMLIHATPGEKIDKKYSGIILKCGKCGHIMTEAETERHLTDCQPLGAHCGKCGKKISPKEFISHFKDCKGLRLKTIEAR